MSTADALLSLFRDGAIEVVDLSATIETSPPEVPELLRTDIVYQDHQGGADELLERFGIPPRLVRNGEGPATETLTRLHTHNSTHVDAPAHYNSEIGGKPSRTIDELPLDWFAGPGVVIDAIGRPEDEAISLDEVKSKLDDAGHELSAGDIVLVRTGCDAFYFGDDYPARGPGVSAEATIWLYDQGIRLVGIDAWGWDAAVKQAPVALERDEPGIFWAAHQIDREYAQIERMVNLTALPLTGFLVVCMPLKIARASAGPTRAVALVPNNAR